MRRESAAGGSRSDLNTLRPAARYYDLEGHEHDVPFYLDRLSGRGEVLELGCGTGRLTMPLARAGFRVVGVDRDADMLAVLRAKLEAGDPEVAGRVRIVEADICRLELPDRFGAVCAAGNTLECLPNPTAQQLCLEGARRHLEPGGVLVLDLHFAPTFLADRCGDPGRLELLTAGVDPISGARTWRWGTHRADTAMQVVKADYRIEVHRPDGRLEVHAFEEVIRYLHRFEARLVLERAGFDLIEECGWYDGRPVDSRSRKLLLVAR